jgi:hypothetical protein
MFDMLLIGMVFIQSFKEKGKVAPVQLSANYELGVGTMKNTFP